RFWQHVVPRRSVAWLRSRLNCSWEKRKPTSALSGWRSPCSTRASTWVARSKLVEVNSMGGKIFVDTNVLIYAHDGDAGKKHDIAKTILRELWVERKGVLSLQVLQEFYVNVTWKIAKPLSKDSARLVVGSYGIWCPETTLTAV